MTWLGVMVPALAESTPVFKIRQQHFLLGTTIVYIAKDCLRIDFLGSGNSVLCSRAPTWDVVMYRLDDKTIFLSDLKSFMSRGLVSELILTAGTRDEGITAHAQVQYANGVPFVSARNTHMATANIIPSEINPHIEQIVWAAYRQPTNKGFPLRYSAVASGVDYLTQTSEKGKTRVFLSTIKMEKTQVPSETFDIPQHLKKVASMQQVIINKKSNDNASNGFADLMR